MSSTTQREHASGHGSGQGSGQDAGLSATDDSQQATQQTAQQNEATKDESLRHRLNLKPAWFALAHVVLIAILLLPSPDGLSWQGQIALAVLGFAVVMWITEAVTYPVSAIMIIAYLALLLGLSGAPDAPGAAFGTKNGLTTALAGFSSSGVALVAAALALAAAMQATGLHKRVALLVLKIAGEKISHIVAGAVIISIILAFFVPSATARAGAVVPILLGMVAAFGLASNSKLSALLIITAAQSISIWNVGIKTAAAQNLVALNFIEDSMGRSVSWGQWFLWAAPWSVLMSIALFFIMRWAIKPEVNRMDGGKETVRRQLEEIGPITGPEIRLIVVSIALLFFWSTEGFLHPVDSSTITLVAIGFLLLPRVGVFTWKKAENLINWGTLVVFAVGISLGTLLLKTGAAGWLSQKTFGAMGLDSMPLLATIILVGAFTVIIHLGFASATALSSALIPVYIALAATLNTPDGGLGFVVIQQFLISFGFLLPVSAPQNMLAYGTGAFTTKQFLRTGIPLTIIGYALVVLFSATYWKWLGLV